MISVDLSLKTKELLIIFLILLFFLLMAFFRESLFIFYLRFEISVIPIFLVILG